MTVLRTADVQLRKIIPSLSLLPSSLPSDNALQPSSKWRLLTVLSLASLVIGHCISEGLEFLLNVVEGAFLGEGFELHVSSVLHLTR